LRQLIQGDDILVMPGVYDGFSARLVESRNYKAAFITGAGVSEGRYGFPDVGVMDLTQNVEAAHHIAQRTTLPLLVDADTGYGNAVNVYYAVRAFESAGVAGVMIEDQTWPKRCGHIAGKAVTSAEEMVEKVTAAVEARRDPDFVIKARTDAAGPLGLAEAVRRANLYAEAGADLVFADALLSVEDIESFARNVAAPVAVNMGFGIRSRPTTPLVSVAKLQRMGVSVVIYPRMLTAAAIRGMTNALDVFEDQLAGEETADRVDLLASFDEIN
jgi:2-methylisocitrate lyase-like PEP mutase family enzyme